jgi:hypothetical protein
MCGMENIEERILLLAIAYTVRSYLRASSPVAARCKEWVCGRSLPGTAGSNLAGGMDVCLLSVSSGDVSASG